MELTDTLITQIGLYGVLPAFIAFLFFIMWDVSKEAKGWFAKSMIFLVLGAGFLGFIIKEVVLFFMHRQ